MNGTNRTPRRGARIAVIAFIAAIFCGTPTRAAEPGAEWSVGVKAIKITPDKPVQLAGYAARTKPSESVDQDIYTKALAFKDSAGTRAVIVTVDICILPADVARGVRERIAQKTRLDPAAILLSVSHTHSGPAVSLQSEAAAGQVNPGSADTVAYTRSLQDKLVAVAEQALADMKPAKLSVGSGFASFMMNRRQFTEKGVILGVNPRGLVDRTVPVLRVDSPDGKVLAVLFGAACHGTTVPSNHLGICNDYSGYAREYIEKQYPGAQTLFMMGCGGDANPYPRHELGRAQKHGEELGKEVCRVLESKLQPVRGPMKCVVETADLPLQKCDRAAVETMAKSGPGLHKQVAQQMLAILDRGEKLAATYKTPVSAWQFGGDLTLVALPQEVVVDYVQLTENAIGPLKLWIAAYCHEVCGYLPSKRVLKEGGYETRGLYTDVGLFAPEAEDEMVRAVQKSASDAGRK